MMPRKSTNCQACTRRNTKRMVSCCHCNTWWHYECAGVNDSIADDDRTFTCPTCQKPSSWMPYEATPNPSERGSELGSKVGSTSGKSSVSSRSRRAQLELERLTALRELEQRRLDLDEQLERERLTTLRERELKRLAIEEEVLEATFRLRAAELEDEDDDRSVSTQQSSFRKVTEWQKRQPQYNDVNSTMIPVSETKTSTSTTGTVTQPGQGGVTHQPGSESGPLADTTLYGSGQMLGGIINRTSGVTAPSAVPPSALWSWPAAPGQLPPIPSLWSWPSVSGSSAPGAFGAGLPSQQQPASGPPSQLPPATWPYTSGYSALGAGLPSQQQPASGPTSQPPPATWPPPQLPHTSGPAASGPSQLPLTTWPPVSGPSATGGLAARPPPQQLPATWPPAPYPPSVALPGQQLPAQWPPTLQPPTQLPSVPGPSVQWPPSSQLPASLPPVSTRPESQIPVDGQPIHVGPTKLQIQARLVIPKELPIFTGKPEDWPAFISAYENSTDACGFSDAENLGRLQKYVQGNARLHVESMLMRPRGVPQALAQLEQLYGRPEILVHTLLRKIRDAAAPKENDPSSLVSFGLTVQNLCNYIIDAGQEAHLNNPELLVTLVGKLPTRWMMDWSMYQERCAVVNLKTFSQYMQVLVRAGIHASLYKEMTPTRRQSPQQT